MKSSSLFAIVTSVVLASTSAAHAGCRVVFAAGGSAEIANSTCLFMGSQDDYAAWGADSCNGMANVRVSPQYNDQIVEIHRTDAGRVTIMKNVMRDENIVHVDLAANDFFTVAGDGWDNAVSVMHCH